jgi:hypothetical protein
MAARNDPATSAALQSWVLGFLSGANVALAHQKEDFLRGLDAHAVTAWIDNYCQANPPDSLYVPLGVLYNALTSRAKDQP